MSTSAHAILAKWGSGAQPAAQPEDAADTIFKKWAGTPAPEKPPESAVGRAWDWLNAPNKGMEKFTEEHPTLSVPLRIANAAGATIENFPRATYEMLEHPVKSTEEQATQANDALGVSKFVAEHPVMRSLDPTGGALTAVAGAGRGIIHNLYQGYEGGVLPEAIGAGTGNVLAGKASGELLKPMGNAALKFPGKIADLSEAVRATPEEIEEKAAPGLATATAQRQTALNAGLKQARANLSPLYENLHEADEADNPGGAIEEPEIAKEFAAKQEKAPRLTIGERQDMDMRSRSGAGGATRGQVGAQLAQRLLADGMNEDDVESALRSQFAFSANQAKAVMRDATGTGEGGTLTIAKARALRSKLYDAADRAAGKEDYETAAKYGRAARQLTGAMRERASELGLQDDFDRADAGYAQAREDQRVLKPLTDALEGDRTPSPEKFQKAWDSLTTAQRLALRRLASSTGMDVEDLAKISKTTGKVLKGARPVRSDWLSRYMYGYMPARLGAAAALSGAAYLYGRHHSLPEGEREILYTLPMAGYVGAGLMSPVMARAAALEAMNDLPEGTRAPSYAPQIPTVRSIEEPPVVPSIAPRREITLSSRIGPRRQLPSYNGPGVEPIVLGRPQPLLPEGTGPINDETGLGIRTINGRVITPGRPRLLPPIGGMNVLPSSENVLVPGERLALPPAASEPEASIRVRKGRILQGGRGNIAAPVEVVTPRGAEIDAEIGRLEDQLWRAPNRGVESQIEKRIRQLRDEKIKLIRRGRAKR